MVYLANALKELKANPQWGKTYANSICSMSTSLPCLILVLSIFRISCLENCISEMNINTLDSAVTTHLIHVVLFELQNMICCVIFVLSEA